MTSIDDFIPRFPNQDIFTRCVGKGTEGKVFVVSRRQNLVAKIYFPSRFASGLELAQHEYNVTDSLYHHGISVPKPEGVFEISFFWRSERYPAFVMERIRSGIRLDKLNLKKYSEEYELGLELMKNEEERVKKLGFTSVDVWTGNCFYFPEEKKVILYDFSRWGLPRMP